MRVLVVEDSARLLEAVVRGFRANGLSVDSTADGKSALEYLARYSYDVLILDLNLPRVTGLEVLRALRSGSSNTRVLVLSARDRVEDRVGALHLGADDYLTKPFAFEELHARVLALGRRQAGVSSPVLTMGDLSVDTSARLALFRGAPSALSPKEHALLETLLRNRGHVCLGRLCSKSYTAVRRKLQTA